MKMGAQTLLRKEEFVQNMVLKLLAAIKDAQTKFRMEEFVSSMGERRRLAVMKGVLTKLFEREFARHGAKVKRGFSCARDMSTLTL